MSQSVFSPAGETPASFNKWEIPVKMGLILSLAHILLITISNMFVLPRNFLAYGVINIVIAVAMIVLLCVVGARQRKAMGGYITLQEAFSAIFVAILIVAVTGFIYNLIYTKWIDPHFTEKMKEGTLSIMERFKTPQDKIDEAAANFDKQQAESQQPAKLLISFFSGVVITSIFGFIGALIVRRQPKAEM